MLALIIPDTFYVNNPLAGEETIVTYDDGMDFITFSNRGNRDIQILFTLDEWKQINEYIKGRRLESINRE